MHQLASPNFSLCYSEIAQNKKITLILLKTMKMSAPSLTLHLLGHLFKQNLGRTFGGNQTGIFN